MRIFIVILALLFVSCSQSYLQEYPDYTHFAATSLRNHSWFPACIHYDAYDLKSISSLDPLTDFGVFCYRYDTLYPAPEKTDPALQADFIEKMKAVNTPEWFTDTVALKRTIVYQHEDFLLAKDIQAKKIYFIL
jgi:hypothetical protein